MLGVVLGSVILGVACGTVTGLIPGIHTNLVASLFPVVAGSLHRPVVVAVFLVCMGVSHTVTSILPNVYLGVCEGDDVVNVLPAHRLVGEGRGGDAVLANVVGGLVAATTGALYFAAIVGVVRLGYPLVEPVIPVLLAVTLLYFLAYRGRYWLSAVTVGLSGGLGFVVLRSSLEHALFPLLSGLFGVPLLLLSDGDVAFEDDGSQGVELRCGRAGVVGASLGFLTSFLPGVGSGVASSMGIRLVDDAPEVYLGMTGAVDTADFYLSLATLWVVDKARNGVVVAVNELMSSVSYPVLVCAGLVAVGVAGLVTLQLRTVVVAVFQVVPYTKVMYGVAVLLAVLVVVLSGFRGLCCFVTASLLGCVVHRWGLPKILMMSCIVAPVFIFLVG